MPASDYFTTEVDHAVFRPTGHVLLDEAVEMVAEAIALARTQGATHLLVVTSGWTGIAPPALTDRYDLAKRWAAEARSIVRVAVVAKPEMIDPQKFGVTVARNRGMVTDVFIFEPEAIAWLRNGR